MAKGKRRRKRNASAIKRRGILLPSSNGASVAPAAIVTAAATAATIAAATVPTVSVAPAAVPLTPEVQAALQAMRDKERPALLELIKANVDQHDKAILQLTAAALAVSVTFVAQVAKNPVDGTVPLFGVGWLLLFLSMVSMLGSFHTGQIAGNVQLQLLEDYFQTGNQPTHVSWWSRATTGLSRLSCIFFIFGMIFVLLFSWFNFPATNRFGPQQPPGGTNGLAPISQQHLSTE
jgi:hypothetical protein